MIRKPVRLYRGEAAAHEELHGDGRPIFFTDEISEALGYGACIIEADVDVSRFFEPSSLVYRVDGGWRIGAKPEENLDLSQLLLEHLASHLGESMGEGVYYDIEGGSWSAVEHPVVQQWLRAQGFDGFVCWEGDGMTYAVLNREKLTIVSRYTLAAPDASSP